MREEKITKIVSIFMENGFKGGEEEGKRIAGEILDSIDRLDEAIDLAQTDEFAIEEARIHRVDVQPK